MRRSLNFQCGFEPAQVCSKCSQPGSRIEWNSQQGCAGTKCKSDSLDWQFCRNLDPQSESIIVLVQHKAQLYWLTARFLVVFLFTHLPTQHSQIQHRQVSSLKWGFSFQMTDSAHLLFKVTLQHTARVPRQSCRVQGLFRAHCSCMLELGTLDWLERVLNYRHQLNTKAWSSNEVRFEPSSAKQICVMLGGDAVQLFLKNGCLNSIFASWGLLLLLIKIYVF